MASMSPVTDTGSSARAAPVHVTIATRRAKMAPVTRRYCNMRSPVGGASEAATSPAIELCQEAVATYGKFGKLRPFARR